MLPAMFILGTKDIKFPQSKAEPICCDVEYELSHSGWPLTIHRTFSGGITGEIIKTTSWSNIIIEYSVIFMVLLFSYFTIAKKRKEKKRIKNS